MARPPRFVVGVICLVSSTVGVAAEPEAPNLALESYRLPNGLKVALHRDPSVPRVTVCVAYHVGSKDERAGRTGFAHFFEHMMFRGTKNVPNYDTPLQETGAQSNAFTNEDMTVYFETVSSNFLERALYLEAERLAWLPSALDQAKFDTEREVVKNERRQSYENVPYGLAEETILANVFPKGHPYSWSVIGSMADLNRASLADLKRFFAEFYHPGNATLCLAGDFDPARAKELIAKYFGPLATGPRPTRADVSSSPAVARSLRQADRVQLPRVYLAWPTVADDHPDARALDLLAAVLAGGDASRLHKALVLNKRVAKDVSADSDGNERAGLFIIQATSAEGKATEDSEKLIDLEIERIQREPPSAAELQRALAKIEQEHYTRLTSGLFRAIALATGFAQQDDPAYYRREFAGYFKVKPADIQAAARTYLTSDRFRLRIEPVQAGEPETEAVVAGPSPRSTAETAIPDRAPAPGPDWTKLPGPSPAVPFRAPKIVRRSLANGLDLWCVPWRTMPVVDVQLILPAGAADDLPGKSGLATLTARLLDKGTKTKTATALAEALEALGVTLAAAAAVDRTSVGYSTVARNLEPSLAMLGEILSSPRFDPADFDRERGLQLADLLQGPDSVGWIARRAFPVLLYGSRHPYANPPQGHTETVKSLSLDDVRRFHGAHFRPRGSILIVVGDVDPDHLVATLDKTLGAWRSDEPAASPTPRSPGGAKVDSGILYLADKPGAVQSVLNVGRVWVGRDDPRYFATLLGNRMLGGDFLSRLNQNLRERNGFTYGAGSSFAFRRTGSTWSVGTSVRADATAAALKEVLSELDGLAKDKPFTATEIGTAREAEARSYPETFETPGGIAVILAEMAEFGLPADYLDTFLTNLQKVRPGEIAQAMKDVVAAQSRVHLVVGDRKLVEPTLRALGFREIRLITPDGSPEPR